jgi:hypothetical protein
MAEMDAANLDLVLAAGEAIASSASDQAAQRIRNTLALCCAAFTQSVWPQVMWKFSGLTADGCPLEFAFSSHDHMVRYTADVAPPETPNEQRLAAALVLASRLGHPCLNHDLREWERMQRGQPLAWGARIGVRDNGVHENVKLYIEVPPQARRSIQSAVIPPIGDSIPVMIGYEDTTRCTEYYFRQTTLLSIQMDRVLGAMVSDGQRAAMRDRVERLCRMPMASALTWMSFGYSLKRCAGGAGQDQLAILLRSQAIGGARPARQSLLEWMPPAIRQRSSYGRLVSALPDSNLPDHGVLELSCVQPGSVALRAGLSGLAVARLMSVSRQNSDLPSNQADE